MTSTSERGDVTASVPPADALDVLLRFGAMMLQAGNTAVRTRKWVRVVAPKLGLDVVSVIASMDSITASARRGDDWLTATREIGPPGINVKRIAQLEQLGRDAWVGHAGISARLDTIGSGKHEHSLVRLALAVGAASGGFAFLNGAGAPEIIAAGTGGVLGQWLRSFLSHRGVNQYATASLTAITASGSYVLLAAMAQEQFGIAFAQYPAGFIASILFLVPGFPLIAGLFDLIQFQTAGALSRLAYGMMILLSVAFGLCIVVAVAGVNVTRPPPVELAYGVRLLLRAVASFVAGCAFALLFNSPWATALTAGMMALCANSLRLILIDTGMTPAPAAFLAALLIGFAALLAEKQYDVPPAAVTVAPIVIMMPGVLAFETIVFLNLGKMLDGVQAFASCSFIVGGLAMGLAATRILVPQR